MRNAMSNALLATFSPKLRLVELGCGTGDEALTLADRGTEIIALDPSEGMLRIARAKAASRVLGTRIRFVRAAARDLPQLRNSLNQPLDGGYAAFSLAYEPDLRPVAEGLHMLLRPGALSLASIPSKICLVEFILALLACHPSFAGRRLQPLHGHKVGHYSVPIRTYTPKSFAVAMGPHFALLRWHALPAIVPPPYMNRLYSRLKGGADALEKADPFLARHFPFRSVGDHFLALLRHVTA